MNLLLVLEMKYCKDSISPYMDPYNHVHVPEVMLDNPQNDADIFYEHIDIHVYCRIILERLN